MLTSSEGVPAAKPASLPSGRIAWAGQTAVHSPQRVQAARKAASDSAPGGLVYWPGENLLETASTAWPSARRKPVVKNDRRSIGSAIVIEYTMTERPATDSYATRSGRMC